MNKTRAEALLTRECILDAGVKCFGQMGYDQTSITSIAQEAGVSRGAVYGHFEDKEAIFRAVVDYNIDHAHFWKDIPLSDDMHFADRLAEIYWHALENNPYVDFIFSIIAYIEIKPEFSDIKKDIEQLKTDLWEYIDDEITRELRKRGCTVERYPYDTPAERILAGNYDGVMLSNGPGDPAENTVPIAELRKLFGKLPMFGICLGHQLMALSQGGETVKLKYGHRGANQPVRDLAGGRTYITSQNHGYAVVSESLKNGVVRYIQANDKTCEGVDYPEARAFSVQFHPEACAGPADTAFLFDRFCALMGGDEHAEG